MAPAVYLAPAPRIPKLTYRNCLPADDLSFISQTSSVDSYPPSNDPLLDHRLVTPHCTPVSTPDYDNRSTASSKPASLASSDGSVSRESKASSTKKKKNGVLNFLTLKEPSQSALEQFAEAQRKQGTVKGGLPSPVGVSGISLQKLPSTVPKVNSKWDGVPESLKSSRNSITSSKRTSTLSSVSSRASPNYTTRSSTMNSSAISIASNDSRGPPNSLASPMFSTVDVTDDDPAKYPPRADSPSSASLPEMTSYLLDDPSSLAAPPASSAHHPEISSSRPDQDPSQTVLTDYYEKLSISESDPITSDKVDALFRRLNGGGLEAQHVYYDEEDDDDDEEEGLPDTHDFLFDAKPVRPTPPRASSLQGPVQPIPPPLVPQQVSSGRPPANFSRPRPNQAHPNQARTNMSSYHQKYGVPALPTLYEASIASTDDADAASIMSEMEQTGRRGSAATTDSFSAPSIAPSTAPSFTPSVMSASWYRSSRERLGLGGRIRKTDVLPWEQTERRAAPFLNPLHMHPPNRDDDRVV